jgi:hypothetical protein
VNCVRRERQVSGIGAGVVEVTALPANRAALSVVIAGHCSTVVLDADMADAIAASLYALTGHQNGADRDRRAS